MITGWRPTPGSLPSHGRSDTGRARPSHICPSHICPNHTRPSHICPNHARPNHARISISTRRGPQTGLNPTLALAKTPPSPVSPSRPSFRPLAKTSFRPLTRTQNVVPAPGQDIVRLISPKSLLQARATAVDQDTQASSASAPGHTTSPSAGPVVEQDTAASSPGDKVMPKR